MVYCTSRKVPRPVLTKDAGSKWMKDDTTFRLSFSSLSPCRLIRVEGDTEVRRLHSTEMGDYRFQINRWSSGLPVYKLINSKVERYLLVPQGKVNWSIRVSTNATSEYIVSGRTTNSPTSADAGPSVRLGVTRWRYYKSGDWPEGDISVTCLD